MEGIIIILVGVFYLTLNYKFRKDRSFGSNYVKNNPKAYIWRKMFGEEKALRLIRTVFIPMGFLISVGFIIYGLYLLIF